MKKKFYIFKNYNNKKKINKLPKKVLIISSNFMADMPGGVPTIVDGRAKYLSKKCKVLLCAKGMANNKNINHKEVSLGNINSLKKFGKIFILFEWFRLLVEIIKYRPDYIEVHNLIVGLPVINLLRTTYCWHGPAVLESKFEDNRSKIFKLIETICEYSAIKRTKKIVIDSKAFKNVSRDFYKIKNKKIIIKKPKLELPKLDIKVNFISSSTKEEIKNKEDLLLKLVCVRRLVRRTGIYELINAYKYCLENDLMQHNSELTIIGDGKEKENIIKQIHKLQLTKKVNLLSNISNNHRNLIYANSDWNIVPTQALEGFGLIVIEAAIVGCPSLVTNVDALPYVVNSLNNIGYICNKSTNDIAEGLSKLTFQDEIFRERLINIARQNYFFQY